MKVQIQFACDVDTALRFREFLEETGATKSASLSVALKRYLRGYRQTVRARGSNGGPRAQDVGDVEEPERLPVQLAGND